MKDNQKAIASWDGLAEMLREELAQYGQLFRQLEDQRAALIARDPSAILEASLRLEERAVALDRLQQQREGVVRKLRLELGLPERMTIGEMIRAAYPECAPLIEELLREVNRLIHESRLYLASSRALYRKSWEIGQAILAAAGYRENSLSVYTQSGIASNSKMTVGSLTNQLV